jgi:hypothetical protein
MGPITHGNTGKCNRFKGTIRRETMEDVIDFLSEIGKDRGESYATRFIREMTSIGIRKEEEGL